ncbi:MAG: DHH family phosphoesterase [Succiniclasticum sp.]|jgi:c-di-AMP phosphodiesterase-like protein|uniref:C-di-AMP phosphodiesterase, consists of a GGDEF-like and DHH domains n=1 Tax=Succiniclasticum ruminis TaxID=40841 RepID=A0A1G6HKE9_9FIRM|nr:DHH family phosphoesterase [Succiniclasticum ruminis]MBQ2140338.1 DHH family phosphoesterase [Acidaminococcaceae bacterium]MEE3454199.1 DHH family phosphoesterase [Succiniclasticum sp.]SDB94729.1 c-di-AMP phosphodiesterase, consists of a GGDEF-like and DHH domains [Succiniclasticum ruminis]
MFGSRSQFSNWKEICIYVLLIALLVVGICFLQPLFIPAGVLLLIIVVWFARRAYTQKKQMLSDYLDDVIRNIERSVHYSTKNLDVGIAVFSSDGKLQWKNEKFQEWTGLKSLERKKPEEVLPVPENAFETMCVKDDCKVIQMRGRYYQMQYFSVQNPAKNTERKDDAASTLMVYLTDITEWEKLKQRFAEERMCLACVRFDNYEDVMKGLSESARANLNGEIGEILNKWVESLQGFVVRSNKENLVVGINYKNLQKAIEDKFSVLDKVREVRQENKLAPTISIGISKDGETLQEISLHASKALDLALGRGGDQVVVECDKQMQYFGGTNAVSAKSTRVRARIVAHTIREQMELADKVFVMGHANEDYDSIGSAVGIAKLSLSLQKPTFIVISNRSTSLQKLKKVVFNGELNISEEDKLYEGLFVHEEDVLEEISPNSLLMLVDHHRAVLSASQKVLEAIPQKRIIIDHHRRAEDIIQNTILKYMEPSSSSASELVTELTGYFNDKLEFTKGEATALYSGLVVDTKNFNVQTGARTFEAAALLRTSGADPILVRQLFKDDLESFRDRYRIIAEAETPLPHLAISINRDVENSSDTSILAAQAADALINVTGVSVGVVISACTDGNVNVSARSDGSVNVQVIMEELGGGGHQTVAGVQLQNADADEVKQQIIELTKKQLDEAEEKEKNESNLIE